MKTCPTCHRTYGDEIRFCLADGATLERAGDSASPTMTMPAPQAFQAPPPPTLLMPPEPSMSTGQTLLNIFISPARTLASFRDVTTFAPAMVRVFPAAAIIVIATLAYSVLYQARVGSENIVRASMEATPRMANLPADQKERAIQTAQQPAFRAVTMAMGFGLAIVFVLASMPLGALIYWLGAMLFKGQLKYMQALLVWTYATLPVTVLWFLANTITLLVWPPTNPMSIVTGSNGVFKPNLGALFNVEALPIPAYVAALSAFDLLIFYGLALAILGLRKAGRVPWIGALVTVIFVWLIGVGWRTGAAAFTSAIMK
jgi:Yip1-like protein